MKRILSIFGISVLVFSCSVEEINHPSEADAPLAARFEPVVTVDQETYEDVMKIKPLFLVMD